MVGVRDMEVVVGMVGTEVTGGVEETGGFLVEGGLVEDDAAGTEMVGGWVMEPEHIRHIRSISSLHSNLYHRGCSTECFVPLLGCSSVGSKGCMLLEGKGEEVVTGVVEGAVMGTLEEMEWCTGSTSSSRNSRTLSHSRSTVHLHISPRRFCFHLCTCCSNNRSGHSSEEAAVVGLEKREAPTVAGAGATEKTAETEWCTENTFRSTNFRKLSHSRSTMHLHISLQRFCSHRCTCCRGSRGAHSSGDEAGVEEAAAEAAATGKTAVTEWCIGNTFQPRNSHKSWDNRSICHLCISLQMFCFHQYSCCSHNLGTHSSEELVEEVVAEEWEESERTRRIRSIPTLHHSSNFRCRVYSMARCFLLWESSSVHSLDCTSWDEEGEVNGTGDTRHIRCSSRRTCCRSLSIQNQVCCGTRSKPCRIPTVGVDLVVVTAINGVDDTRHIRCSSRRTCCRSLSTQNQVCCGTRSKPCRIPTVGVDVVVVRVPMGEASRRCNCCNHDTNAPSREVTMSTDKSSGRYCIVNCTATLHFTALQYVAMCFCSDVYHEYLTVNTDTRM
jgi:hypothetical protein